MRILGIIGLALALSSASVAPRSALPAVRPNANTEGAGVLRNGVLTVTLEAKQSQWYLDGPHHPPITTTAFAEPGKPPLIPGPLVRAPAGTELRLSIRNSLRLPLTFYVPASIHGGPDRLDAMDSIVVAPGAVGTLTTRATVAGNHVYRATTRLGRGRLEGMTDLLTGAVVVDTSRAVEPPRDRVFVIVEGQSNAAFLQCVDTTHAANPADSCRGSRVVFTINGRSWPNTERINATVGDSLHWRVINASNDVHPMHLHGFYFRIDDFSGPFAALQGRPARGELAVTQLMTPFSTMSITWSPDHAGNWIFHCHFAQHNMPDSVSVAADDPHMRAMVGLVLSVNVADRPGVRAAGEPASSVRHLRLVAVCDSGCGHGSPGKRDVHGLTAPSMRFVLEENGQHVDTHADWSPNLDLVRGEPVAVTIVNHLDEPTSVHWHGIEIQDSYFDGVPGVSGTGQHPTPAIAPGDSFVARFTPPRSGSFMYHAHVDDFREQLGGLEGAVIVRDSGTAPSPDDHVFFLKEGQLAGRDGPIEVNGQLNPDTVVLHVGRPTRLRLLCLTQHFHQIGALVSLTARTDSAFTGGRDTLVARWVPLAKDGADLPVAARAPRVAQQVVGMGETYDFEYTPRARGELRIELRQLGPLGGQLLARVPIRVE